MDPKFVVSLSGREYPLFAGILAEAHERGLQSIETQLIQIPTDENAQTAIVKAVVRMKDGSTFEGYGDANPRNVNPRIATATIRMAETRAKGRALRDAINCGMTMLEELPDLEGEAAPAPSGNGRARAAETMQKNEQPLPVTKTEGDAAGCEECGVVLTAGQANVSKRNYGRPLCPAHQKEALAAKKAAEGLK